MGYFRGPWLHSSTLSCFWCRKHKVILTICAWLILWYVKTNCNDFTFLCLQWETQTSHFSHESSRMEFAAVETCLWHAVVPLCSPLKPQRMKWPLAHKWHYRCSAHTFLLSDEAYQNTDGVFIQVVRYVGTIVTWGKHRGQRQRKLSFLTLHSAF